MVGAGLAVVADAAGVGGEAVLDGPLLVLTLLTTDILQNGHILPQLEITNEVAQTQDETFV